MHLGLLLDAVHQVGKIVKSYFGGLGKAIQLRHHLCIVPHRVFSFLEFVLGVFVAAGVELFDLCTDLLGPLLEIYYLGFVE